MQGPLLLRADADFEIGTGHVMRLLALVEAWQETQAVTENENPIVLLGCVPLPSLRRRLAEAGVGVWDLLASHPDPGDLAALSSLADALEPAWIVLDGYHFDPHYQAAVHALGFPLLVVDDLAQHSHYHADLVLNQNLGAGALRYAVDPGTRLLLDTQYCLLRSELRAARSAGRAPLLAEERPSLRLLITMGGVDPHGLARLALEAFATLGPHWEAKVVVGNALHQVQTLRQYAANLPRVEILEAVHNMGALMNWADLALAASGSTTWELASLGVPTLLVVAAENQLPVAQAATAAGFGVNLGWWQDMTAAKLATALEQLAADDQKRAAMRRAGQHQVDGAGAMRVVQAMRHYCATTA